MTLTEIPVQKQGRQVPLLRSFEVIADSLGGVERLRKVVLQLAVKGKLVPQDPRDEPATGILEQIGAQREGDRDRQRRSQLPTLPPPPGNPESPHGWVTARLGDFLLLEYGKSLPARERVESGTVPVYGSNGQIGTHDEAYVAEGAIVVGRKGSAGALNLVSTPFWPTDVTYYVVPPAGIDLSFCYRWLQALPLTELGKGIKPGLNRNDAYELVVSLPPLAEQRRITAKVDQLMALCDELEQRQRRRAEKRVRLNQASLHRLTTAKDGALTEHWRRIRENFDLLYDAPETVADLRQAVLALAVQGRLVQQDPSDEPASVLLERIRAEKQRLCASGEIRKPKEVPPMKDEVPFQVPEGWEWVRLGQCIIDGPRNGYSPQPVDYPTEVKSLILSATTSGSFDRSKYKYIDEEIPADSPYWLSPGDLLFQRGNTIDYVGIAAVYEGPENEFIYPDLMIRVRCSPLLSLPYIHLVSNSEVGRTHFKGRASGTSGSMPKINQGDVISMPVPVPPYPEQRRIVRQFVRAMDICDRLETQLSDARVKAERVAAAIVRQLGAA